MMLVRSIACRKDFGCAPGRIPAGVPVSAHGRLGREPDGPAGVLSRAGHISAAEADGSRQEQGESERKHVLHAAVGALSSAS